jgi:hypothetical protein
MGYTVNFYLHGGGGGGGREIPPPQGIHCNCQPYRPVLGPPENLFLQNHEIYSLGYQYEEFVPIRRLTFFAPYL